MTVNWCQLICVRLMYVVKGEFDTHLKYNNSGWSFVVNESLSKAVMPENTASGDNLTLEFHNAGVIVRSTLERYKHGRKSEMQNALLILGNVAEKISATLSNGQGIRFIPFCIFAIFRTVQVKYCIIAIFFRCGLF